MRRFTPLNLAAALAVAGLLAATVVFGVTAQATPKRAATHTQTFRQALAAKLGAQLHKPAADVLAALKPARKSATTDRRTRRANRLARRADRLARRASALKARASAKPATRAQRLAQARARRDAWAAAVAKPLGVSPADVTAALRALVAERLDSLVAQRWITADRRAALLACFDDTAKCARGTRPLGLAFLRRGV
jgi:hypothetical protein